jgi:hypothetical protein
MSLTPSCDARLGWANSCPRHREAFHYGNVSDRLDQRLVVHLRVRSLDPCLFSSPPLIRRRSQWYTKQDPRRENRVEFFKEKLDIWGLPSPRFTLSLSEDDKERNERSMEDMKKVSCLALQTLSSHQHAFFPPAEVRKRAG